jgi:flagellar protein FliS
MSTTALRDRYVSDAVSTASPARLLVMLVDRLALDCERAVFALETGDFAFADENLRHAQEIVLELRTSLDASAWDGASKMAALYDWLLTETMQANIKRDRVLAAGCLTIAEQIRETWTEAARLVEAGAS